jgi:hypothetical protein
MSAPPYRGAQPTKPADGSVFAAHAFSGANAFNAAARSEALGGRHRVRAAAHKNNMFTTIVVRR